MFASYNYEDVGVHQHQRLVFKRGEERYVLPELRQFRLVIPHRFRPVIEDDGVLNEEESIQPEVEVEVEDDEVAQMDESQ